MIIELTEAELEVIVEALARFENDDDDAADTLYRRFISGHFRTSAPDGPTCEGCGETPTVTHDADGYHLCKQCALSMIEQDKKEEANNLGN